MIASDVNNPHFAGARSPDDLLAVQFYTKPFENEFQSKMAGRPIYENVDCIKIWTPGNTLSIIDTFVRDDHKERFPRQWQAYKNRVGEIDTREIGTPITQWPRITPAQAEELKALKFFTVEAIAGAGDAQLQGIGMIAGQSIFAFRDDAKRFLSVAAADSKLKEAEDRVKKAEEEIAKKEAEFQKKLEAMEARFDALLESSSAQRKPGRPPRAEKEASE